LVSLYPLKMGYKSSYRNRLKIKGVKDQRE
jgi:hypothetical protein